MKTKQIVGYGILAVMVMMAFPACNNNGDEDSGKVPPYVGKWYRKIDTSILVFEITSVGKFIMADTTYDISVAANTATLTFGGTAVGTFSYAISNGEMVITEGTGIGITIAAFSPVVKKVTIATPIATPSAGTYLEPQSITLSSATEGASIYYTIDNTTPTASSTLYTSPIGIGIVAGDTTLKAIAIKGSSNSDILTAIYTIIVSATLDPPDDGDEW